MMKRFLSAILSAMVIVLGLFIWYLAPIKLLPKNTDKITKIYLYNGNTGRDVTITDAAAIHFIVEELHEIRFKRDGLALGMGSSYRLQFLSDNGNVISRFVLEPGGSVKKAFSFIPIQMTQRI